MSLSGEVLNEISGLWVGTDEFIVSPLFCYGDTAFMKGKGTPEQLADETSLRVEALAEREGREVADKAELRRLLAEDPQVGLDCSAFVFHVLNGVVLARQGRGLASHLAKPITEVRADAEPWKAQNPFTEEDETYLASVGDDVPLLWVCRKTRRTPQSQVNVARLTSHYAAERVDSAAARPGDILAFIAIGGIRQHAALVGDVNGKDVQVWDCGQSNVADIDQYGGIGAHEITIAQLAGPIANVEWSTPLEQQFERIELFRLKALADE